MGKSDICVSGTKENVFALARRVAAPDRSPDWVNPTKQMGAWFYGGLCAGNN